MPSDNPNSKPSEAGEGNVPQGNVLAASRRLLVEQRLAMSRYENGGQSSNTNVSTGLHPSAGGPRLEPDRAVNEEDEVTTVVTAATSTVSDDLEKGKAGTLVEAYTVYPTNTASISGPEKDSNPTMASLPHPDEHTRTANDRALASILNADNTIPIVPGQIVTDEDEKEVDKLGMKKPMKEAPKGYFARDTRRGAALLALVLGIIALIVIICTTVPKSRAQSVPSSALDGSTGITSPTDENLIPAPSPTTPPPTTDRWAVLRRVIRFYDVTPEEILDDPKSPQHAALNWLANVDSGSSWSTSDDVRVVQRYVLATLYYATEGDGWTETYGWLTDKHECEWYENKYSGIFDFTPDTYGIVCDDGGFLGLETGDTVLDIHLESNNLMGTIPPELHALTSLEVLHLSDNSIGGSISPDLFALPNLKEMSLQKNQLSGGIPATVSDSMTYLDLSFNKLEGTIPDTLWDMTSLTTLSLADNPRLTGSIGDIGDMTELQVLNLGNLDLDGTIPESVGDIASLQFFNASHNGLTGSIPDVFDRLLMITDLDLEDNKLSGTIPSTLASMPHPLLTSINLQKNQLSGDLPAGLAMNVFLTFVGLSDNELNGEVPWTWGTFLILNTLTLDRNKLTGDIESLCYVQRLTADCLGENPEVGCSCCSQCCDANDVCN